MGATGTGPLARPSAPPPAPPPSPAGSLQLERLSAFPADWDGLLAADGGADYSHTRHWSEAVCRHYEGARCLVLTVRRAGVLIAGLSAVVRRRPLARVGPGIAVRRADSSLEGTSGGPLLAVAEPAERARAAALLLVDALADERRGLLASAAMALNPAHELRAAAWLTERPQWLRQDSPTAMISLQGGLQAVAAHCLSNNKRNERNRGLRRGATVDVVRDPQALSAYYPLYLRAAAHWAVAPVPLAFLQDLLAGPAGGGPGGAFFTRVHLQGRLIGGHLNVHLGDKVQAWNGVTDPEFARTHFPATLAVWGDLGEACRLGASWLDLGASGPAASLEDFKRAFGAHLQARGYYVLDTPAMRLLRRARALAARARGLQDPGAAGGGSRPGRRWHDRGGPAAPGGRP